LQNTVHASLLSGESTALKKTKLNAVVLTAKARTTSRTSVVCGFQSFWSWSSGIPGAITIELHCNGNRTIEQKKYCLHQAQGKHF